MNAAMRITIRMKLTKAFAFPYIIPKGENRESVVEELRDIVNDESPYSSNFPNADPLFRASSISALKHFQGVKKDSHDDFVDQVSTL